MAAASAITFCAKAQALVSVGVQLEGLPWFVFAHTICGVFITDEALCSERLYNVFTKTKCQSDHAHCDCFADFSTRYSPQIPNASISVASLGNFLSHDTVVYLLADVFWAERAHKAAAGRLKIYVRSPKVYHAHDLFSCQVLDTCARTHVDDRSQVGGVLGEAFETLRNKPAHRT